MIDIIILSTSSKKEVLRTLHSIVYQIVDVKYKIYILDYNKKIDYSDLIQDYKCVIDIEELKYDKCKTVGEAKQFALEKTKNRYILFINSNDIFTYPYAIFDLYDNIKNNNADMAYGNYFIKNNGEFLFIEDDYITFNLKLYRRKFIDENCIKFNNLDNKYSFGFQKLFEIYNANIVHINKEFGVIDKKNYIGENMIYEIDYYINYIKNVFYIIENYKINKSLVKLIFCSIYYSYYYYIKNNKIVLKEKIIKLLDIYNDNKLTRKKENEIKMDCVCDNDLLDVLISSSLSFSDYINLLKE